MPICDYFDHYSCLHLASGITAYFWGLGLVNWLAMHIIFTVFENSSFGLAFTEKYLSHFKPYKDGPDDVKNLIGDTISALIGWLLAYSMEKYNITVNGENNGRSKVHDRTLKTRFKKKFINLTQPNKLGSELSRNSSLTTSAPSTSPSTAPSTAPSTSPSPSP